MTAPQRAGGVSAWASHDLPGGPRPVNPAAGLVSLSFIGAALHRRIRLVTGIAAAGLVFGAALFVLAPPPARAATSLIITHDLSQNPVDAMQTDVALAQTRAVAAAVVRKLALPESVSRFLASYTVAATTDRIMTITLSAKTSAAAVRQATALAATFLTFRAAQLRQQQGLVVGSLKQQLRGAQSQVAADQSAVSDARAHPGKQLSTARQKLATDKRAEQELADSVADYPGRTASQVEGSYVYDVAAPVPASRLRVRAQYLGSGLLLGLVLGTGGVAVAALASDRLRRRDDIARALGEPVRLSVGRVRLPAGRLSRSRVVAAGNTPEIQQIAAHLRRVVADGAAAGRAPAVAVVPADDPAPAALAVVTSALSLARQGRRVLVADLSAGARAARLLGVTGRGVRAVSIGYAGLLVVAPDGTCPAGPLGAQPPGRRSLADADLEPAAVADAWGQSDVMICLATLDPGLGGDHLLTWAAEAVVMITAGQCPASRIHATAEMIRLPGLPITSAVLTGADRIDDSVGATPAAGRRPAAVRPLPVPAVPAASAAAGRGVQVTR